MVHFVPGKMARVSVGAGAPVVEVEDTARGQKLRQRVDLVVLAAGVVPARASASLATDRYGFLTREQPTGQIAAGSARGPIDVAVSVRDATSAALCALGQCAAGGTP
jgi:quinone-modifying oxidoreductase subunit QmoA